MGQNHQSRSALQRAIRWGPWTYRFWRELIRPLYNRTLLNPAVVNADEHFPAHNELLDNFIEIRKEVLAVALSGNRVPSYHEYSKHQKSFYEYDKKAWGMLPLRGYGFNYPENQNHFPALKAFLKNHRDVVSATVSFFPPGKILRPHKGAFKFVWRYHLPLFVTELPNGRTSCELTIDGKTYFLKEGQGFLWDDTFMHSATNQSDQARVVILFDVFRDDQPLWLKFLSWSILFNAQIVQSIKNTRQTALLRKVS